MGLLNIFKKKKSRKKLTRDQMLHLSRQFDSAKFDNIFAGWTGTSATPDEELRGSLSTMRARTRSLCQNSEYAKKFLNLTKSNVVGSRGFKFQAKTRNEQGALDKLDNNYLERLFFEWSKNPDHVSIDGRLDWLGVQNVVMETLARDGEVFIRMMKGGADNPFGFSLWVLEGDSIPIDHNIKLKDEQFIIMGVEQNKFGKPLDYYQAIKTPNQLYDYSYDVKTERVPDSDMIHLYIQERPSQSRGVPWLNTAIRPLQILSDYTESSLVASRIGASAIGFFKSPDGAGYVGDGEDEAGNLLTDFQPGTFQQLPAGMEFEAFDPKHPTTNFPDFVKAVLRGAANGCGVSYNALANDLENVNYSSIRAGVQEDQAHWKTLQQFMISRFCYPVYRNWLKMGITTGQINLPMSKLFKFEEVVFHGRGWSYVDPYKELRAKELALQMGVTSIGKITSEAGEEWTDIFAELAAEKDVAEGLGLNLTGPVNPAPTETIEVENGTDEEN